MKSEKSLTKSILLLLISLILMGFGINLITHANLGTTAITSPPFVLSLFLPLTFGTLNTIFNIIYILIQVVLLKKDFPKIQYLQIIVSIVLGLSIDGWGLALINLNPNNYIIRILLVIVGSFVIALSTVIQLDADLVNNPAEGIVRAISIRTKSDFSRIKTYFDLSLVILAVLISLIFLRTIAGVREGTIISAVLVGQFISLINRFRMNNKNKEIEE